MGHLCLGDPVQFVSRRLDEGAASRCRRAPGAFGLWTK